MLLTGTKENPFEKHKEASKKVDNRMETKCTGTMFCNEIFYHTKERMKIGRRKERKRRKGENHDPMTF